MAITILLDGLNQIGTSIAMALDEDKKSFHRIGFDYDPLVMRDVKKAGYIDQLAGNGLGAAAGADIIIIDQPVDLVEEHYQILSEFVRPKATILDTSMLPVKAGEWAEKYIPKETAVVSFVPGVQASYLYESTFNHQAAHADLFVNSNVAIASPSMAHIDGEALATALARVLGATPIYMDAVEVQVALVKTRILPRLLSAAWMNMMTEQPGWEEARILASGDFAKLSFPIMGIFEESKPGLEMKLSEDITLRLLDEFISNLQNMKSMIAAKKSDDLYLTVKTASSDRALWQSMREQNQFSEEPRVDMPKAGDVFQQLFLGGLGKKRKDS